MNFYSISKKILFSFFPKSFIKKNEIVFRKFYSLFYRGENVECNICKNTFSKFIDYGTGTKICPNCGSSSRGRRLAQLIEKENTKNKILHFSPPLFLKNHFEKLFNENYFTSDFLGEFQADYHFDITNINFPENTFSIIIAYHILEHIEDDKKAMKELFRILTKHGKVFIQTPFKKGIIYENPRIISDEDRTIHFGQKDHVRIYSVEGLVKRLENVGFSVEIMNFEDSEKNMRFGFIDNEIIIIATKN